MVDIKKNIHQSQFEFSGAISASKSLMNRALICKIFFPDLRIKGFSDCKDVAHMKEATIKIRAHLGKENASDSLLELDCGEAGTVLRFLSVSLSRFSGEFQLKGTSRLFQRPHEDVENLLKQLNVEVKIQNNSMLIKSSGWRAQNKVLKVSREKSSQFASGFLLSCWNYDYPIHFQLDPYSLNDSYFNMTVRFLQKLGMQIEQKDNLFYIPPYQKIKAHEIEIEPDFSSVFSIAALAALGGNIQIINVGKESLQPDFQFIHILKKMSVPVFFENKNLIISKAETISPIDINLEQTPDLFPVLSVLCAFAKEKSVLRGAPRLAFKESNRIIRSAELLQLMNIRNEIMDDGLVIYGQGSEVVPQKFIFDPDQDHRMAMAAGILKRIGWDIQIQNPEVVNKSFPEFWNILGLQRAD